MRYKILIIAALISLVLIIGTASADPDVKRTKTIPNNGHFNVEVEVTGATNVFIDDTHQATQINPNLWQATDIVGEDKGDYKLFKIRPENGPLENAGSGGCTNNYDIHDDPYPYADVYLLPSGISQTTTFFLNTESRAGASIIGICVFPNPPDSQGYDVTIASGLIGKWVAKFNGQNDKFEIGRINGEDKIFLDGTKNIETGTVNYQVITDSSKILLHVFDPSVCDPEETCWRSPGTTIIPEFATIALPIAAVLGLVFFFQHRKKKEE